MLTNSISLTSLTVYQNTAAFDSGGVYANVAGLGSVSTTNSIFDGNTVTAAGFNGPLDFLAVVPNNWSDIGFNLVGGSEFASFVAAGDIIDFAIAPGLANTLANNNAKPGYPQTLALALTSPGYETGNQNLAGTIDAEGLTRQSGQGLKVSIGAYDPDAQ